MNDKYKLIKKYPSLPKDWEEGMLMEYSHELQAWRPADRKYYVASIDGTEIYSWKDYWEVVNEPTYRILQFKSTDSSHYLHLKSDGKYNRLGDDNQYNVPLNSMLVGTIGDEDSVKTGEWQIWKVEKLEGHEIYTIGDKTIHGIIEKFVIDDDDMCYRTENLEIWTVPHWKHTPVETRIPIYISEDGVQLYKDDNAYWVIDHGDGKGWRYTYQLSICNEHGNLLKNNPETYKVFSTEENARKWCKEEQERLIPVMLTAKQIEQLKELLK